MCNNRTAPFSSALRRKHQMALRCKASYRCPSLCFTSTEINTMRTEELPDTGRDQLLSGSLQVLPSASTDSNSTKENVPVYTQSLMCQCSHVVHCSTGCTVQGECSTGCKVQGDCSTGCTVQGDCSTGCTIQGDCSTGCKVQGDCSTGCRVKGECRTGCRIQGECSTDCTVESECSTGCTVQGECSRAVQYRWL